MYRSSVDLSSFLIPHFPQLIFTPKHLSIRSVGGVVVGHGLMFIRSGLHSLRANNVKPRNAVFDRVFTSSIRAQG